MAVAYWQFHEPGGMWPIVNHGEQAVIYRFYFLYLAANGAGDCSLDAWMRRKRSVPAYITPRVRRPPRVRARARARGRCA
jgi:hypothetical protein